jgi:hypothetical protein
LELLGGLTPAERLTQGISLSIAAAATWLIGLTAILCDFFQRSESIIIAGRILFTTATCTTLCLALIPMERALSAAHPAQLRLFVRLVSRWAYIFIYSLAFVRIGLFLWESLHITALWGAPSTSVRPLNDFLFYIVACIGPLWIIRAAVLSLPGK